MKIWFQAGNLSSRSMFLRLTLRLTNMQLLQITLSEGILIQYSLPLTNLFISAYTLLLIAKVRILLPFFNDLLFV